MPEIEKIEQTANPNAKTFVLKQPLSFGSSYSFDHAQQARDNPLVKALFEIKQITKVFYVYNWLTVTQDGTATWDELLQTIAAQIESVPAADVQITQASSAAANEGHSQNQPARFMSQ